MIIGITGGIGSGKSTIAHELARRGCMVYDCDREAKRIIAENNDVRTQVIAILGKDAFTADGMYNTSYVAGRVFAEPELRVRLNAIVHPAVLRDIKKRLADCDQDGNAYFFIESAILFEAGLDQLCERIIFVDAPIETRIRRVIDRDYNGVASQVNINKVLARIRTQRILSSNSDPITLVNDGDVPVVELANRIFNSLK